MRHSSFRLGLLTLMMTVLSPACLAEIVESVRLQGNFKTPDAEVLRLAGISVGNDLGNISLSEVEKRLLASGHFESVNVAKRYPSLVDTERVVLLIEVREKQTVKSRFMIMPILTGSDEYGLTYGARFSAIDLLSSGERVSFRSRGEGSDRPPQRLSFHARCRALPPFLREAGRIGKRTPTLNWATCAKSFLRVPGTGSARSCMKRQPVGRTSISATSMIASCPTARRSPWIPART